MCDDCWRHEYAAARIDTPAVRETATLIADVYRHEEMGGRLHAVLDDWNIEDEFFEEITDDGRETTPERIAAEERCHNALRALTLSERASALALHRGYWSPPLQVS